MNTILEKILKGEITSDDLTDPLQIVQNEVSFIIFLGRSTSAVKLRKF